MIVMRNRLSKTWSSILFSIFDGDKYRYDPYLKPANSRIQIIYC